MDQLMGWALQMDLGTDHTYVTSSAGHVWPCWGRHAEGRRICVGDGSAAEGDCLSRGNSGIIYGVTGLCWQTANRVLYPAGKVVDGAKGYGASLLKFGAYGTNNILASLEWSRRKSGCAPQAPAPPPVRRELRREKATTMPAYVEAVDTLQEQFSLMEAPASKDGREDAEIDFLQQEFQQWADYKLGAHAAPTAKATEAQRSYHANAIRRWRALDQELIGKLISAKQYADYFHEEMNGLLKKLAGSLGEEACMKLFGTRPDEGAGIIDANVLAESRGTA
jgi:hypothetical protein